VKYLSLIVCAILVFSLLFFSFAFTTVSAPSPLLETVVRLDPAIIELGPDNCINDTFTLKARVDNVEDLTCFALHIVWNTSYLEYVDHIVKVPVETYPDGLLHGDILWVQNEVNASEGWYWVAIATLDGPSFYGSGIAFEITFSVKYQPVDPGPEVNTSVGFILPHDLADSNSWAIPHSLENCSVTILPCWNLADVNDDLKVNIFDVMLGVNAYQATPSDPHWNPRCDLANPYDIVDIFDIVMIVGSYGEEYLF